MLTQAEQLFLEQVNRARLDPLAEAARFGIELNAGLPAGSLDGSFSRQPLAANDILTGAARAHSADYQTGGVIGGHTGSDGRSPADRAEDAGYGSRFVGENLGFMAATNPGSSNPAFSAAQAMVSGTGLNNSQSHHQGLFLSPGHRQNMLNSFYIEAGIGQDHRIQTNPGWAEGRDVGPFPWTSSVVTAKFGRVQASDRFLTGVVYNDTDNDQFYSLGESVSAATISIGTTTSTSAAAGGYALKLTTAMTGLTSISIVVGGQTLGAQIALGAGNVKLDVVDGIRLLASSDLVLGAGIREGGLLGLGNLSLHGNGLDNLLLAGRGNNLIDGGAGTDTARFTGTMADYQITVTAQNVIVRDLRGGAVGQGTNTLTNVERLQFADQVHILSEPEPAAVTVSGRVQTLGGTGLADMQVSFAPQTGDTIQAQTGANGHFSLEVPAAMAGRLQGGRPHDASTDPAITASDALDVLRLSMGLAPGFGPARGAHFIAADINGDGMVTHLDALETLRAALGLTSPHAARWLLVDGRLDLDAAGLDAAHASLPAGIDLGPLGSDLSDLPVTAILLGNIESVA